MANMRPNNKSIIFTGQHDQDQLEQQKKEVQEWPAAYHSSVRKSQDKVRQSKELQEELGESKQSNPQNRIQQTQSFGIQQPYTTEMSTDPQLSLKKQFSQKEINEQTAKETQLIKQSDILSEDLNKKENRQLKQKLETLDKQLRLLVEQQNKLKLKVTNLEQYKRKYQRQIKTVQDLEFSLKYQKQNNTDLNKKLKVEVARYDSLMKYYDQIYNIQVKIDELKEQLSLLKQSLQSKLMTRQKEINDEKKQNQSLLLSKEKQILPLAHKQIMECFKEHKEILNSIQLQKQILNNNSNQTKLAVQSAIGFTSHLLKVLNGKEKTIQKFNKQQKDLVECQMKAKQRYISQLVLSVKILTSQLDKSNHEIMRLNFSSYRTEQEDFNTVYNQSVQNQKIILENDETSTMYNKLKQKYEELELQKSRIEAQLQLSKDKQIVSKIKEKQFDLLKRQKEILQAEKKSLQNEVEELNSILQSSDTINMKEIKELETDLESQINKVECIQRQMSCSEESLNANLQEQYKKNDDLTSIINQLELNKKSMVEQLDYRQQNQMVLDNINFMVVNKQQGNIVKRFIDQLIKLDKNKYFSQFVIILKQVALKESQNIEQLRKSKVKISKLRQQRQQLEQQVIKRENMAEEFRQKWQQQRQKRKQLVKQLQQQLKSKDNSIMLKKVNAEYQRQIEEVRKTVIKKDQKLKQLNNKIREYQAYKQQNNHLANQLMKEQRIQMVSFGQQDQNNLQAFEDKHQELLTRIEELLEQVQQKGRRLNLLEMDSKDIVNENQKLLSRNHQLQNIIKEMKEQNEEMIYNESKYLQTIKNLQIEAQIIIQKRQKKNSSIIIVQREQEESIKQEQVCPQEELNNPMSPVSSPSNSLILVPQNDYFKESEILPNIKSKDKFLVGNIQKFVGKGISSSELRLKMTNKNIQQGKITSKINHEVIVWLFKGGQNIFAAVSFPATMQRQLSVVLLSLTKQKVVFPAQKDSRWLAMKSESFFLTFGINEAKFIWKSKNFIVPEESKSKYKYFQPEVSIKTDIVGSQKQQIEQFEAFFIKFKS